MKKLQYYDVSLVIGDEKQRHLFYKKKEEDLNHNVIKQGDTHDHFTIKFKYYVNAHIDFAINTNLSIQI